MQGFACIDDARKPENRNNAAIAPAVERTLGKGEVACSNHAGSTIFPAPTSSLCNIQELAFLVRALVVCWVTRA